MQASSCTANKFNMANSIFFEPNNRILGGSNKQSNVISNEQTLVIAERRKLQQLESDSLINCVFTWARNSRHILEFSGVDHISPTRASNHRYGPVRSINSHRRKLLRHKSNKPIGCLSTIRTSR